MKYLGLLFAFAIGIALLFQVRAYAKGKRHGKHDHVSHRFNNVKKWVKRFDDPERDAWQMPEHVVELMGIEKGMVVADIGAGTGYFLPYLSRAVGESGRVHALDVEPNLVVYMKKRAKKAGLANVEVKKIPYDSPGLEPNSVDRLLVVNTWHHIGERAEYVKKVATALRPSGSICVVDFTKDSPNGPPKAMRISPEAVAEELKHSLVPSQVTEKLPRQYVVSALKAP